MMAERHDPSAHWEPPEAGVGGEGPIVDETVLAPDTDAGIERGVHDALRLALDVDADHFVVTVENGVVSLTGRTRSPEELHRAADAAQRVHGVRRVVHRLTD